MKAGRVVRIVLVASLVVTVAAVALHFFSSSETELRDESVVRSQPPGKRLQTLKDYNDGKKVNIQVVRQIVERYLDRKAERAEPELLRAARGPDEEVAYLSLKALQVIGSGRLIPTAIAVIKSEAPELVKQAAGEVLEDAAGQEIKPDDYDAWSEWYDAEHSKNDR